MRHNAAMRHLTETLILATPMYMYTLLCRSCGIDWMLEAAIVTCIEGSEYRGTEVRRDQQVPLSSVNAELQHYRNTEMRRDTHVTSWTLVKFGAC